ncbi:MAG: DUF2130 domain-containing protein [Bacteroidia bacterium]
MAQNIKCPNCAHEFPLENAIANEIENNIRNRYLTQYKKDQEAIAEKEKLLKAEKERLSLQLEDQEKIVTEKVKLERHRLEQEAKKKAAEELDVQLNAMKEDLESKNQKLKESQQKELEFLRKEQEFKNKEAEFELLVQKKLQEERTSLGEQIRKQESEKNALKDNETQLKIKELEKQLEDQRKLAEEMKRKAEQGSMQLQGEVQELALEEMLRNAFPFDTIAEVAKGVRGADAVQLVRNQFGQECGKIIYESKRTKAFGGDWIEKLKHDMRTQSADVAVLVTEVMPKDMEHFGERSGVWVCSYAEVKALAHVLRDGIIKVSMASKSQENKGDKMHMLYDYLTSNEFAEQWKAIREGFMGMKISIQKERDTMEKLWKTREKQLEKVLLNAAHIRGSIDGIAGQDAIDLNLLDDGETPGLE